MLGAISADARNVVFRDNGRRRKSCLRFRGGSGKDISYAFGREAGTEGESHHRSETVRCSNPDEIEARNGRFKTRRENRCALDCFEGRTNTLAQKRQSVHLHFVTCCCDDVFGFYLSLGAINRAEMKLY